MFCPKNETFQNITEKTKLLAQKCSQQIRIAAASAQQQQQQRQQQQQKQEQNINNGQTSSSSSLPPSQLPITIIAPPTIITSSPPQSPISIKDINLDIKIINSTINNDILINNDDDDDINNDDNDNDNNGSSINGNLNTSLNKLGSNLKNLYSYTGGTIKSLKKKYRDGISSVVNGVGGCTGASSGNDSTCKWYVKQPTWRLWGEEREKDAIFTVYLKKVRYHRPTPSANHDSDDEISHLEWETVRVRFVKAATLSRLVEALATDDGELESTFINVFLSTYRTFSTPKQVLDLLIKRYDTLTDLIRREEDKNNSSNNCINNHHHHYHNYNNHHNNIEETLSTTTAATTILDDSIDSITIHEQHKKTLVSALHVWLDGFPEDWNEDNLKYILAFSSKRLQHSELHLKVLHRLEICLRIQAQQNYPNSPSSSSSSPSILSFGDHQFSGLCLAPAFRGPPQHLLQAYRFPNIPVKHFAEQLTRMDMELFKRLIPHQCLGATWSKRDKHEAETVVATVTQFNAVSYRVISSILIEPRLKSQERALHIATWIDIAQELRLLKNFSSLKAIISGLQSNAIYRLSKTWAALPKEKMEIFNELARIFSEENNAWAQREVLMREGTAKFADTVGENDRHLQKAFQKQNTQTSHGTIPYLGTFLTDLTMIHAAIPDTINNNKLINFDKKRKEFEVLAQIKLLQGAANTYNLRDDNHFDRWFASMLVLDEREAHTLSCQLEIPQEPRKLNNPPSSSSLTSSSAAIMGHRKSDSIASNSSSGTGSQFYCEIQQPIQNGSMSISLDGTTTNSSRNNSLDRDTIPLNSSSILSASSSVSNLSIDSSNSGGQQQKSLLTINNNNNNNTKLLITNGKISNTGAVTHNGQPIINAQLVQNSINKNLTPDFYIIRVTYETDNIELDGIVLYKSIMLGNNERTPQVIRNSMMKLDLEGDPDQFTLAQVLPDKELLMPSNANVYYAVNTMYNLNFILRPKRDGIKENK